MKFYSLIHQELIKKLSHSSILLDLGIVQEKIFKEIFLGEFKANYLTYYYFTRLASLEIWLRSL